MSIRLDLPLNGTVVRFGTGVCAYLLAGMTAIAQEQLDIDFSRACFVDVTSLDSVVDIYGFGGSTRAKALVNSILVAGALQPDRLELMAANIDNAAAAHYDIDGDGAREQYILYSEAYLNGLEADAKSKWKVTFVFAHEIAHLINGHLIGMDHRPSDELAADQWAGWILHVMGASLKETCEWVETCSEAGDPWHPDRKARKEAVVIGWNQFDPHPTPVRSYFTVEQDSLVDQSSSYATPLMDLSVSPSALFGVDSIKVELSGEFMPMDFNACLSTANGKERCADGDYRAYGNYGWRCRNARIVMSNGVETFSRTIRSDAEDMRRTIGVSDRIGKRVVKFANPKDRSGMGLIFQLFYDIEGTCSGGTVACSCLAKKAKISVMLLPRPPAKRIRISGVVFANDKNVTIPYAMVSVMGDVASEYQCDETGHYSFELVEPWHQVQVLAKMHGYSASLPVHIGALDDRTIDFGLDPIPQHIPDTVWMNGRPHGGWGVRFWHETVTGPDAKQVTDVVGQLRNADNSYVGVFPGNNVQDVIVYGFWDQAHAVSAWTRLSTYNATLPYPSTTPIMVVQLQDYCNSKRFRRKGAHWLCDE